MLFTPPPPPPPSKLTLITAAYPAGVATLDFTGFLSADFERYVMTFERLLPAVAGHLYLRSSRDGGATWDQVATDYYYTEQGTAGLSSAAGGLVPLTTANTVPASAQFAGLGGSVILHGPGDAAGRCNLTVGTSWHSGFCVGQGAFALNGPHNGLRVWFSSGNIASGAARLYGIAKA